MSHGGMGGGGHHGGHHGVHHGGHHGHGAAGHHPDQAPNWSQAMQGEKNWKKFARVNAKHFALLFFIFFGALVWLYIIYKLHHQDAVREGTNIIEIKHADAAAQPESVEANAPVPGMPVSASQAAEPMPAGGMYSPQAQSYATQAYAGQFIAAATTAGTGAAPAQSWSGYPNAGITPGAGTPAYAAAGQVVGGAYGGAGRFGSPAYAAPYGAAITAGPMSAGAAFARQTQPLTGNYIPAANGRCRLVVNR